jgi:hypothetical protein
MGRIYAGHIHSGQHQSAQARSIARGRPNGGDNFSPASGIDKVHIGLQQKARSPVRIASRRIEFQLYWWRR